MLIVSGRVTYQPADLQAVLPAAQEMVAESRKEDGCIEYEFAEVIGEPGVMRIFERWESRDHLAAHAETPHMATWRAAASAVDAVSRDLFTYEGDFEVKPL